MSIVPALSLSMNETHKAGGKGVDFIDWLVYHPEAFIVFWLVIAILLYVLLTRERGVKDENGNGK